MHPGSVFTHQQHGLVIEHRHHHHGAMAAGHQPFKAAAFAIGEFQIQMLALERPAFLVRDLVDDGQATAHASISRMGTGENVFMSPKC